MRTRTLTATVLLGVMLAAGFYAVAQEDQSATTRKIVNRVVPAYPDLARTMQLTGLVRLEATVSPTGKVTLVKVKGGNPLLAQAAESAVRKWKWEPAAHESNEIIEVKFHPQ